MKFLNAALTWFGDPDPRLGTAWEKAKDWRSSSHIAEPYWFWMAWSRSKIRLVRKKVADHERTSALRRDLKQLSSDAGAKLLRAVGVKGPEVELRSASDEFSGQPRANAAG